MSPTGPKIPYGGDYNPEQWPQEVWDDDHRLFTRAGIDTLTVGVFTWSVTQPAEDVHDFTVLDRVLDRAGAAHAAATDLLTGERVDEGGSLTLGPLDVAVLRLHQIVRPRASGTPDLRRK
ncbi:beta-galactosidase [Streptomyces bobili]|jgi:hypothetical protein|uniref:beta-galactosidase n=1 Tax=Streptomyces bobili TaxID=67280 RepID=UPI000D1AC3D0